MDLSDKKEKEPNYSGWHSLIVLYLLFTSYRGPGSSTKAGGVNFIRNNRPKYVIPLTAKRLYKLWLSYNVVRNIRKSVDFMVRTLRLSCLLKTLQTKLSTSTFFCIQLCIMHYVLPPSAIYLFNSFVKSFEAHL
jgi:hypothetical protein